MRVFGPPFRFPTEKRCVLEEKVSLFSTNLFKYPKLGLLFAFITNLFFIYSLYKQKCFVSIICHAFFLYLISSIGIVLLLKMKNQDQNNTTYEKKDFVRFINDCIFLKNSFKNFIRNVISFENNLYTIEVLLGTYLLIKITSLLGDKFIILILLNAIIFYAPLENKYPRFVFRFVIFFQQLIEGILCSIQCLIPKYQEKTDEEENKKSA